MQRVRPKGYGKEPHATPGSDVHRSPTGLDVSNIAVCSHKETYRRLILHAAHAVLKGHRRVCICTIDSHVLVLAVASFDKTKPDELWVILGSGSNLRCIAIHELMATIDPRYCSSLPIFHAFTGCDMVSPFSVRGTKTAWQHGGNFQRLLMHSLSSNACLPRSVKIQCHRMWGLWCSCLETASLHIRAERLRTSLPPRQLSSSTSSVPATRPTSRTSH